MLEHFVGRPRELDHVLDHLQKLHFIGVYVVGQRKPASRRNVDLLGASLEQGHRRLHLLSRLGGDATKAQRERQHGAFGLRDDFAYAVPCGGRLSARDDGRFLPPAQSAVQRIQVASDGLRIDSEHARRWRAHIDDLLGRE